MTDYFHVAEPGKKSGTENYNYYDCNIAFDCTPNMSNSASNEQQQHGTTYKNIIHPVMNRIVQHVKRPNMNIKW